MWRVYVKYALSVLKHKWFVLVAGYYLELPIWRIILHDWTKFRPDEFFVFAKYKANKAIDKESLFLARDKHFRRNDHHWQHWKKDDMPLNAIKEMFANWLAKYRAKNGAWPKTKEEWRQFSNECLRAEMSVLSRRRAAELLADYQLLNPDDEEESENSYRS